MFALVGNVEWMRAYVRDVKREEYEMALIIGMF